MSADETQLHRRRPAGADERAQCSRGTDQIKSYDSTQPLFASTVEKAELVSPDNTYNHLARKPLLWRFREGANKWWAWEATAAIISTASLVAVMALLAFINGKPLSYWRFSMMPNAVVATLMTVAKSSMLLAMAESIKQLKWQHFHSGPQRLLHLQWFNSATAGPLGGLSFLWNMKNKAVLASCGAVICIVAFAMDPFSQQILSYQPRLVEKPDSLPWTPSTQEYVVDPDDQVRWTMKRPILAGFYDYDTGPINTCSTGNCTWPDFSTLGICDQCADVSDRSSKTCAAWGSNTTGLFSDHKTHCGVFNITTPGGIHMSVSSGVGDYKNSHRDVVLSYTYITTATPPDSRMSFKNPEFYHLAMAQLRDMESLVSHGWFQEPHWNITECRFSFCAKVYRNVRMINGTMSSDDPENVPLEAVPNSPCWETKAPPPNSMYDFKGPACMEFTNAPNTELPSGANSTFLVQYAGRADAALLGLLLKFKAEYKLAFRPEANGTELKQVSKTVTPHGSNPGFNVLSGMEHRGDNISNFMHRVAHSMTNQVRTSSDVSGKIYGTALHMETFIVVRWKWLGLPVAVIVFGVAFLVTTIALNWTKKTVLWKSNDLPLLTHGLEGWDANAFAGVETSVAIRRTAGEMRARLGRNADGELRFLRA